MLTQEKQIEAVRESVKQQVRVLIETQQLMRRLRADLLKSVELRVKWDQLEAETMVLMTAVNPELGEVQYYNFLDDLDVTPPPEDEGEAIEQMVEPIKADYPAKLVEAFNAYLEAVEDYVPPEVD